MGSDETSTANMTSSPDLDAERIWVWDDFRRAYEEHSAAVYGLARCLGGPQLADDVTCRVFLRLWDHPDGFDPSRVSLRTFLVTMAQRVSSDMIRSERADRMHEALTGSKPKRPHRRPTATTDRPSRASIDRAFDLLDDEEREAIVTTVYSGCTLSEVAVALCVPEDILQGRIRRGLQRLSVALAQRAMVIDRGVNTGS